MLNSIRSKLTLSYLLIILISMAVTGFFFQSRMGQVFEDSLTKETGAQATVVAEIISSLATDPNNIIGQAESLTDRYSEEMEKSLTVYSTRGFLIADSNEPDVGYLSPGQDNLDILFPRDPEKNPTPVTWEKRSAKSILYFHKTWPIVDEASEEISGALDVSIVLHQDLSRDILPEVEKNITKIGEEILENVHSEKKTGGNFEDTAISLAENPVADRVSRIRFYNRRRFMVSSSQRIEPAIVQPLSKGRKPQWFDSTTAGRALSVAAPIRSGLGNLELGNLVLSTSMKNVDIVYAQLRNQLLYAIGISSLVTVLISLFLAFNLIRPLTKIQEAAKGIGTGDFSTRVEYKGQDEIKALADTINYMASQIEANISEITSEKDKMNALLSALPDGVIALDRDGTIQFINSSTASFFNVKPDKTIGKSIYNLMPQDEFRAFFEEGQNKEELFSKEIQFPPRILKFYLKPYGDRTRMMIVVQDVTDIRRLEETRTQFLGAISHELRTPLTIIKGYIYTVIDDEPVVKNPEIRTALEKIDRETDRQARLVSDLLELSRLQSKKISIEMESLRIDGLVEETVGQLEPKAQRVGIEMHLDCQAENVTIFADRDRMKQVIINLVDNAIKYTKTGGKVEIRTYTATESWVLEVADTGMGIAKDELPFLFERFFRTKDRKKRKYIEGTGLGMAIVKEIIDSHKGRIEVDSKEGTGTVIRVYLSLAKPEESS